MRHVRYCQMKVAELSRDELDQIQDIVSIGRQATLTCDSSPFFAGYQGTQFRERLAADNTPHHSILRVARNSFLQPLFD